MNPTPSIANYETKDGKVFTVRDTARSALESAIAEVGLVALDRVASAAASQDVVEMGRYLEAGAEYLLSIGRGTNLKDAREAFRGALTRKDQQ